MGYHRGVHVHGSLVASLLLALPLAGCDPARAGDERAVGPPAVSSADERGRDELRRPQSLVAALAIQPGARIADVGAGDGYLTWRLAAAAGPGGRIVATDIDPDALRRLSTRLAGLPPAAPVEVHHVLPDDPGLEAASFDLIVLAEVDQYLADRTAFFRRLASALARGGRIAVANRLPYRARVLAAAQAAGLGARELAPAPPLPGQFLITLEPRP